MGETLECKCSEINELRPDIDKLNRMYDEVTKITSKRREIEDLFMELKGNQNAIYEADNKLNVISAIHKMYVEYGTFLDDVLYEVEARKSSIESRKSRLSRIDSDYHEEERKRREKGA